jgi:hypothetical protein
MFQTLILVFLFWILVNWCWKRFNLQKLKSMDHEKDFVKILKDFANLQNPFLTKKSLQFALFRTFGIPTISKILKSTKEFERNCEKRYQDTELFIAEFVEYFGTREEDARKRLNFFHGLYNIQQKDYLYTLSVFVLEPVRWVDKFGQRKVEKIEKESIYLYYKDMGNKMGIQNIPNSFEEFNDWNIDFEKKHMIFEQSNQDVAECTLRLLLSSYPPFLHSIVRNASLSLMDERLLHSMNYKKPHWIYSFILNSILILYSWFILILMPPRPEFMRYSKTMKSEGDLYFAQNVEYVNCYPNGYRLEDLGPKCARNFLQ